MYVAKQRDHGVWGSPEMKYHQARDGLSWSPLLLLHSLSMGRGEVLFPSSRFRIVVLQNGFGSLVCWGFFCAKQWYLA